MLIGISPRMNDNLIYTKNTYIEFLTKYNHTYVTLPITINTRLYDLCDGFLIPGGDDIDPYYYNEPNLNSRKINYTLDEIDEAIVTYAYETKKPLLGICRGIQAINVFLGGSLYQNIKDHNDIIHPIVYDNKKYLVNSYHHQSIKDLAKDFKILSKSHGTIEAIKHNFLPILGIQWHPEIDENEELNDSIMSIFK